MTTTVRDPARPSPLAGFEALFRAHQATAPNVDGALVGPMPDFEAGGRYLVTAAGSTINACGYTLDHDAAEAAAWAAAFGG